MASYLCTIHKAHTCIGFVDADISCEFLIPVKRVPWERGPAEDRAQRGPCGLVAVLGGGNA
ncbi:Hypothetical predicted protein [Pelobates cultripes]|uniref:Uncharacterized protein n=1 Tax=Pelobates cultripes TaxID=61616 RepID=A0AAD1WTK0_PELCU|nr:Hypothetical predicted protein [Pelobates cultripes]